jgi:glycosyltransferase involved in cell wall biosynthesis
VRVALITDEGPEGPGGVATWVRAVTAGLAASGCEVFLADRRGGAAGPGVRRRSLGGPSFARWGGLWALAALPEAARADRVIAATWPVATALVRAGLPLTAVAHGSDVTRPTRDPRGRRRVFAQAERWCAVSSWVAAHVPRRALVLPAPVDPAPLAAGGDRWGFVGRSVPEKGGDTFVRWVAAAGVRGELIGDGPALPAWRALAAALGADVTFLGAMPPAAVRERVSRWRLLAAPSRPSPDGSGAEGLGLVVLEAAAAGVPAVVTDVGGLPEAAGPAGLVAPRAATPAEVAAAIAAWWSPARGRSARDHLAAAHGVGRTVAALLGAPPGAHGSGCSSARFEADVS